MSFLTALIASLTLSLPTVAQADAERAKTLTDLAGTTWNIALPDQFPATLQFTDKGLSIIAACNGLDVAVSDTEDDAVKVTETSEIYSCGAPSADEAKIIDTLQSLEKITSETPASLTLTAEDGSTITATR